MNNKTTSIKVINIKDLLSSLLIISFLLPFIQTGYQIFIPSVNQINLIWKIVVVSYSSFLSVFYSKKIDKLLVAVILCNAYMIIPTYLNNGYYIKFFGYFIDSVGLLFVLKNLSDRYDKVFLNSIKQFCRLMIYTNFLLLIVYPKGIFIENNGYLTTRYLFLGMDNQAAIMLVTFMIIIYSIEKKQNQVPKPLFWIDFAVFIMSMLLIWCGNSIVGIFVFFGVLFYQKISKHKITVKTCIKVLFFLFIFINLLQGFKLFTNFIVDLLGKDMTLSGRVMIWENGIKEWLKYPILGHGYQISEEFITFSNISGYVRGAHNQVLNILLFGGVIFLFGYLVVFMIVHKITAKYKENCSINILILGILVNFVMWIADTYGHLVGMYLLIGLLCYGKKYFVQT